ncbi:hypothetical protein D9757_000950 [Collybiopsis confluens]|uniref:NmrA-like domain-containing protein n=1 Tax=Collybiopsis confluens TaxID=2823264 RepID=A0A8H5I0M6_9AGAR|nr:hypothetical protein D9757_000950 [Collybiopsis confluens]
MSPSSTVNSLKRILAIGGTGMQGKAVVAALLARRDDGSPSPYSRVGILICASLDGCYGAFVNTDSFCVGEKDEIFAALKIYELAHRARVKHFIWSGLEYASKLGNFDPKYYTVHYEAKGIVGEFLRSQPSSLVGDSLTWTIITIGPYLENLEGMLLGPLPQRENGKVVWATPVGDGHIPAVSIEDIAWWTCYALDHRFESSGQDFQIVTEYMTIDQLVETFTRVTGIPAVRKRVSMDEYLDVYKDYLKNPIVKEEKEDRARPTIRETAAGLYSIWGDDLCVRDTDWVRRIHPTGYTLESFIKKKRINGELLPSLAYRHAPKK